MTRDPNELESLAGRVAAELAKPAPPPSKQPYSARGIFLEMMVLALGSLYAKLPHGSSLFDRATLKAVLAGIDETEAGKIQSGAEDWIRLEGLVRALEGQKNYTLSRPTLSVLSSVTSHGLVGELMERVQQRYIAAKPSPELRKLAQQLASYFLGRLGRA